MAIKEQTITDRYAIYCGDCVEGMRQIPDSSIHMSLYSPPFGGLYHYSSDERDLSNSRNYSEFFEHYEYVVSEISRIAMPGRMTGVHCMDVPSGNSGCDHLVDFPGDIIRLHEKHGFHYTARYAVWKEPLGVRMRTMVKGLSHEAAIVEDSSKCCVAGADYLLMFRKHGTNAIPVTHPRGLMSYAGERKVPNELLRYRGYDGHQTGNKYSQWIWRQYASAFWDDVRIDRVLPFKDCKEPDDEKHVHPLQLDVIERAVMLWTNPGETVLTPFMGVGSEVYGAVINGRRGIGWELKASYYKQAVLNLASAKENQAEQAELFAAV